jgi:hypothetical protein
MHTKIGQFFHGNGGRGASNAGRYNADRFAQKRTCIGDVFTIGFDVNRMVKEGCYGLAPTGITGKNTIAAYVAGSTVDMKLNGTILHRIHL